MDFQKSVVTLILMSEAWVRSGLEERLLVGGLLFRTWLKTIKVVWKCSSSDINNC